jgi:hypothetical protein
LRSRFNSWWGHYLDYRPLEIVAQKFMVGLKWPEANWAVGRPPRESASGTVDAVTVDSGRPGFRPVGFASAPGVILLGLPQWRPSRSLTRHFKPSSRRAQHRKRRKAIGRLRRLNSTFSQAQFGGLTSQSCVSHRVSAVQNDTCDQSATGAQDQGINRSGNSRSPPRKSRCCSQSHQAR